MTLSQEIAEALDNTIQAVREETQYNETENTIAELKYFESRVQSILKRYMVDFVSE